jgi:twitching motility protein PilT
MAANLGKLLEAMKKIEASDLHVKETQRPLYRIHGELIEAEHPPLTKQDLDDFCRKIIPTHLKEDFESQRSVDFAFSIDVVTRFRVNAFHTRGHKAVAFRLLELEPKSFEELNLPEVCNEIAQARRGLVIVTGPTGSGKTTSLASFINHINEIRREHIVTIEDPIEYVYFDKFSRIDQREVGADCTGFEQALRHGLRQDPDVILVGEMRDKETILLAIRAAQTGHLVFTSLHTTTAIQTISRVLKYFPSEEQESTKTDLAVGLNAILCQRLVPRVAGDGRVPGIEVLIVNDLVRRLIRDDRLDDLETVMRSGEGGMQTFDMALSKLVQNGLITLKTGFNHCDDQAAFKRLSEGTVAGSDTAGLIGAF